MSSDVIVLSKFAKFSAALLGAELVVAVVFVTSVSLFYNVFSIK